MIRITIPRYTAAGEINRNVGIAFTNLDEKVGERIKNEGYIPVMLGKPEDILVNNPANTIGRLVSFTNTDATIELTELGERTNIEHMADVALAFGYVASTGEKRIHAVTTAYITRKLPNVNGTEGMSQ